MQNASAISCCIPVEDLIAITSDSQSFALPLYSPLAGFALPFLIISLTLSVFVPRNMCSGFMHARTSHLWHTNNPSLIGPLAIVQDVRCALSNLPFSFLITPYPPLSLAAIQIQHPSISFDLSTFGQNLSSINLLFTPTVISNKNPVQGSARVPFGLRLGRGKGCLVSALPDAEKNDLCATGFN